LGCFITFEGIEGSGKTTQIEMLQCHLESMDREVVVTREPGGTELGEKIRQIILNTHEQETTHWAELFLYEACRAQLVQEIIKPAIEGNKIVLCDRFSDSTLAYQGYARRLGVEPVFTVDRWATDGITPNLTFILDCDLEVGLKRAWARINKKRIGEAKEDRFEREDVGFHKRVRDGYLNLASREPDRIKVVNGGQGVASIHKEICEIVDSRLNIGS